ncbi:MAG: DEAD/DEAH box helicase [Bacteroidales bacterium]|nr:DEAD/DEAH box helicase [Bacteroidales bacterium]
MNFTEFYKNTEQRLTDAILSLWATGDAETQKYLKYIFQAEKLLAEPVFQTTFPWKPYNKKFNELTSIYEKQFIEFFKKEKLFGKKDLPYKHQVESWDTLINEKKSIVVTTGTGSGKTECFMLPVLYDIYKNCRNSKGINAIFLYPLNALISSQKKRIDAWTRSIGGINYAVYNGNTDEFHRVNNQNEKYPEIISRELIRREPPQILFTNPTMLEYILVRNKDVELLNKSKGKLRWILLDEAHTLTGSTATEMAMLIRRVLDVFGVSINDVRFAATSATVGNDSDTDLLRFMSGLSGLEENKIKIIKGNRILTEIPKPNINECSLQDIEKGEFKDRAKFQTIHNLRSTILKEGSLNVSDIAKPFKVDKLKGQIHLVDLLSETKINGNPLFPVRGHFFSRGIGGVFVCTNPNCKKHGKARPLNSIGTMSTIAGKECNFCGFPLLELVACRSCGKYMLYGEQYLNKESNKEYFQLSTTVTQDAFYIENEEDEEENIEEKISNKKDLFIAKHRDNSRYIKNKDDENINRYNLTKEAIIVTDDLKGEFIGAEIKGRVVCPHCGANTHNPMHFRISSSFLNRILSDIVLEQTPEAKQITEKMLWSGHKYISFTDSRQGTAKVSALINIDSERNWLRSQVFHLLAKKRKETNAELAQYDIQEIQQAIEQLEEQLENCLPIRRKKIEEELNGYIKVIQSNGIPPIIDSRMSWKEIYDILKASSELKTLFYNSKRYDADNDFGIELYLKALFFNQFARRLPRERSLENLGLVNITYQTLDNLPLPKIAKDLEINQQEWNSLIKISADYILRNGFYFYLPPDIKKYSTSYLKSFQIYPSNTNVINVKRFPRLDRKQTRQNRLCLLICAGLGLHHNDTIDDILEDKINDLLEHIWKALRNNILKQDGNTENDGYKINIEEKFSFELSEKLWLCPVKNRLIDNHFKEYSPWITGNLTEENIRHFKVGEPITFPYFQYPFNKNENGDLDMQKTKDWIENNCKELIKRGVWNDLHERIIQVKPLFLAGEHSAQQTEKRLQKLEGKFEEGKINILSCSTTMEMGVDIGGISVVVMNNVPPSPTNYLQRAGRAGRRAETKSFALTFCAANPIGSNAMDDPMWALNHKIASSMLSFNSANVVERHINAFFLGKFVQSHGGMNITETIDVFFFDENNPIANQFQTWLLDLKIVDYQESLNYLKKKTPLEEKTPLFLLNLVINNFEKILSKTKQKGQSYNKSLEKLKSNFGENSPAYKSVSYQFNQFRHKHVIGYLAEERFIPSAGMPTGVVNFDTTTIEDLKLVEKLQKKDKKEILLSKPNPSYHITRALTEYAPGNNIVIDGWNYVSAGIILKSEWGEAKRDIIQSCSSCGYQRIIEISEQNQIAEECPQCNNNSLKGLLFKDFDEPEKYTELIEPTGFSIDLFQPANRNISATSNSQYIEPLLIGVQPWTNDATSIYDIRESIDNAEILYYNMGNGNGYSVCLHCGKTAFDKESLKDHRRLRGGKSVNDNSVCSGTTSSHGIKENVVLGGRFKTDFCEIRFREIDKQYTNDEITVWSLGVLLTKTLTSYLGIEESELSFGVKRYDKYRSLFIFDNAAGGAGYSVKFSYYAEDIFNEALNKLKNCSCEKACTKCLIDRSSQWFIQKLDRNTAIEWLEQAVKQTVPTEFKVIIPNLKSVLGTIREDIRRVKYRNDITKIWFFIDNKISDWDLENAFFISDFKKNLDNKINFVVSEQLNYSNDDNNRITAIQISSWADFYLDNNNYQKLKPLCQIQLKAGSFIIYYSAKFDNSFNEKWGISENGYIYKTYDKDYLKLEKLSISLPESKIQEIFLSPTINLKSNELAKLFIENTSNSIDLKSIMQNQKFDIVYSDRYLKSPFSCLLLIQFIKGLKKELNFDINKLQINVQTFREYNRPYKIFNNYFNSVDRENELKTIASNNNFQNITVQTGRLPHYRFLEFKNNEMIIIIRPDGGIEHGWFVVGAGFYSGLTGNEEINIRKGVNYPILYSIIVK